jgi:ribosomal protein S18 acetylase RimI-like enzyme
VTNSIVRKATLSDLDRLVEIENRCFERDRLSKRSLRHLITRGHTDVLVVEHNGDLVGDLVILLNNNTSLARVYSIAVEPAFRRRGFAKELINTAEKLIQALGFFFMRLEVSVDNHPAITLYETLGYRQFGRWEGYYGDAADALRMEKRLRAPKNRQNTKVPYYEQTLSFSCGPAALMMGMSALDPDVVANRGLEVRLWRESTSVFMTSGHGGTTPFGLAVAAARRGFRVEVFASGSRPLFIDSVRSDYKKDVIALTEDDYIAEMRELNIPLCNDFPDLGKLRGALNGGAIPLVLISTWRLYRERAPHWVVLTGFDAEHVYIHDPWIDPKLNYSAVDKVNIPIRLDEFEKMSRYGRAQTQIALVLQRN